MANLSKNKRDRIIAFLEQLKVQHNDDDSIRAFNEIENHLRDKKYGLVWEEHKEYVDEMLENNIPIFIADKEKRLCKDASLPWNFIIEGDNLQALYLLEKTHKGKVDCIYIDPPYNTGARDWKYNNDYVDSNDTYRHSKWLSMMNVRLKVAKQLLNPEDSMLIVAIDDNELATLKLLLSELFPESYIQIVDMVINPRGKARVGKLSQVDEYLLLVYIGEASTFPESTLVEDEEIRWPYLRRSEASSTRDSRPNQFYPIYVSNITQKIVSIGKPLTPDQPLSDAPSLIDATTVFPIKEDGTQMLWGLTGESLQFAVNNGCVRVSKSNNPYQAYNFAYVTIPSIKKLLSGEYKCAGIREDGTKVVVVPTGKTSQKSTVWQKTLYDANAYGTKLIGQILGNTRFSYPKSLYSVYDALKIYLAERKEAIVLDFFAGSGTTQHAVNLLNAEDGGNRKCIMVTNNEISEKEEKRFLAAGIKKGSEEWESKGIAQYVTWPRTQLSIEGVNIHGQSLSGKYIVGDRPMSDGFRANVKYLKCDWTPRKPEDYLLSNLLMLHIKEMIELQNAIEIDNEKNVLILNRTDMRKYILDEDAYSKIERIWINQNIILNAEEVEALEVKGYKHIPKEFFGQELREAAE